MKRQIIVIGGGAAGMMAAIIAAQNGARVTILEHNDRIGKKILSTGNGRCNFTNVNQASKYYRSDNKGFAWKVIEQFSLEDTLVFFEELGIFAKNKNGGLYPFSEQASAILDVLRMEIERLQISVITEVTIVKLKPEKNGFQIICKDTNYYADAVILATGSKAAPKLGSDGSGYSLAKSLGHHIIPVVPALVQLRCKETFFKALSGVRLHGKVHLLVNGKEVCNDIGEIQLTDYGISGIPVFQVSRFASKAIYEKKKVEAILDFMPDFSEKEFLDYIYKRISIRPEKNMEDFLTGILNKKVAQVLLKNVNIRNSQKAGKLKQEEIERIAKIVKEFRIEVIATNSFDQAQICAGGVNTKEIDPRTMESLLVKNVYFAGELIDVDGICGGYNLQWAWSSGYLAGKGAAHVKN